MRSIEIETLADFDRRITGATHLRGWRVQGLDLTGRDEVLGAVEPSGSLFLGCRITPSVEQSLINRGALIFPSVPDIPFDAYRGTLYSPAELYAGLTRGYPATPDARIYAWFRKATGTGPGNPGGTDLRDHLAMALHDNAIDDALAEFTAGRRIAGVMGGHALARDAAGYLDAAILGQSLARTGTVVATGGGPGAMEAANLGAALSDAGPAELISTVQRVAAVCTDFRPDIGVWATSALDLQIPLSDLSLGIPTWFYGHEPPNAFAGRIAKYFRNAIREDILLHLCRAGIVFLPGAAGTVQEIFQAACENYYAAAEDVVAPMVLVGKDYWTRTVPAYGLVRSLGADRFLGKRLHLVDRIEEVPALLELD